MVDLQDSITPDDDRLNTDTIFSGEDQSPHDTGGIMDDVWGDDDDEALHGDNDRPLLENREMQRTHHKQGYLDGLTQGKELSLQEGFDNGFPQGGKLGMEVGKILSTILCYDKSLMEECKKDLSINKVLDKKYFNDNLEMLDVSVHQVLVKWHNKCNELRTTL